MAEFKQKYQDWLSGLTESLTLAGQQQLQNMLDVSATIKAYLKAGKELSAYESQLFLETLKQQWQQATDDDEQPSMWAEELWQTLSQITDKTQVEWAELLDDVKHQGVYQQGEYVGMGRYYCRVCRQSIDYTHPAELLACSHCGGVVFERAGLPV